MLYEGLEFRVWGSNVQGLGIEIPQSGQGVFFFVVAPFCSFPASLVSRKFFAVGPGCAKCFCCAPLGAATFRRGQSKKKKHPGCFFFAPAPRLFGGAGAKKKTPWVVFFFLLRPRADAHSLTAGLGGDASPSPGWCFFFCCGPARTGVVFFFLLWPRAGAQRGFSFPCLSPGPEQKKKKHAGWCFFFALAPCRRPTGLLLRLPFAGAAAKKKKTPWVVFFFCSGPVPAPNGASPSLAFRRGRSKKKTPWVVFFFLLRPRADAHSLTAGLGGDASPSPGWCFFFFAAAPPGPGWCFFFCCGPARTLTHSRWAGAISARPGWCFFFCCGPAGSF